MIKKKNIKTNTVKNKNTEKSKKEKRVDKERSLIMFNILLVLKTLIFLIFLAGFSLLGIFGGTMSAYYDTTKFLNPSDLILDRNLTTYIYDSEKNTMAELTGSENINREEVLYDDLPKHMVEAVVAIEDERFFEHIGIDLKGIISSVVGVITNRGDVDSTQGGGSTITQQLIKIVTGRDRISFERKVQEWFTAIDLEKSLTKEMILEKYLNVVNEGNGYYGVGTAAKKYFGKNIKDISIAEAAILASIPNAPSKFNPRTEKGYINVIGRQQIVLSQMRKLGKITDEQYMQAVNEKIIIKELNEKEQKQKIQSYFVDEVINEVAAALSDKYGITTGTALNNIYSNGYKIHTTMVPSIQKAINEVYTDEQYIYKNNTRAKMYGETPQSGIVIINPKNGHVVGMYGGLGEKTASRTTNRATSIRRQCGSSIKPLSVYGPSINERLITPATIIDDVPVYMLGENSIEGRYPQNFDHKYNGLTTVRNGLKSSVNVISAKILTEHLGIEKSREYLGKVNIDITDDDANISGLALGGLHNGVSPLQMAAAYVPFVNKGLYYEPVMFTKVYDKDGKLILSTEPEYKTIYDEKAAYLMVDMMKEVVSGPSSIHGITHFNDRPISGTAWTYVNIKGKDGEEMPTAGKTGTTSDNRDKWFVGYTPYYTAAVWYGYDNRIKPIEINAKDKDGYNERLSALSLWNAVMNKVHENLEIIDFERPDGLVEREICIYSGQIATDLCKHDLRGDASFTELFIKGTEPRGNDFCEVHIEVELCTACVEKFKVRNTSYGGVFADKYLLAGENCPPETRLTRVMIKRPEGKEIQLVWHPLAENDEDFLNFERKYYYENREHYSTDAYPLDWIYEEPFGEYCTIHGIPEDEQLLNEAENAGENTANGEGNEEGGSEGTDNTNTEN
jgi:penicillin-binding protein 1A